MSVVQDKDRLGMVSQNKDRNMDQFISYNTYLNHSLHSFS